MPRTKIGGLCKVEECGREVDSKGLCRKHYMRQFYYGRLHKVNLGQRRHPLYIMWHDRKQNDALCEKWKDFWQFASDVGEKPEGNHFLVRIRGDAPYGPDNFKWQEHLKRKEGESKKDWWARKWAARQAQNPGLERKRTLMRRFGLNVQEYDEMVSAQNGQCAICDCPETSYDPKTGSTRRLSVDHCHQTGRIRKLLCFRCNATLGKMEENPSLFRKMAEYIESHTS